MKIPAKITAGDTVKWTDQSFTRSSDGLVVSAAGGWTLAYSLRGPVAGADLAGTANGTGWDFTLDSTVSAALNATPAQAVWYWQARATLAGVSVTAGDGTLVVKPNLANLTTGTIFDGRSLAEATLSAIDAEITARITNGASVDYTIGNRSLKKEPLAALMALRTQYRLIVRNERRSQSIANGLGNPSRVGVRFK